jgi:lysozyme family protein
MSDFLDEEIRREGGDTLTNDPTDRGGVTKFGISQRANPTINVASLTHEQAKALYQQRYVDGPGFGQLPPSPLKDQLIDFGITSGPHLAIIRLQRILEVPPDGVLGPQTLAAIAIRDSRILNNLLLASRIQMIADLVAKAPAQVKYLRGWISRALEFLDAS